MMVSLSFSLILYYSKSFSDKIFKHILSKIGYTIFNWLFYNPMYSKEVLVINVSPIYSIANIK